MALRFNLANIGFSGGELKLKSRIDLHSGVLAICPNFRSANSFRRLCNSSNLHADTSSSSSSSFTPKSYYDVLMEKLKENYEDTLSNMRAGGGHWECAVQMPEVLEAADLAVKLYNNQQLELVGLVKAYGTIEAGWWFEIILEAVDHDTGEKNEYEACVWLHAYNKSASKLKYLRLASDKS